VSEVLTPGINGEYAKNTVASIAGIITDLLEHPKKREEYGHAGHVIAKKFTEKRQAQKLIKIYEDAVVERNALRENRN